MKIKIGRTTWDEEAIFIQKEPSCEHCGELEPYTPVYADTCTKWCLDCADGIPDEVRKIAEKMSNLPKAKFYHKKLNHSLVSLGLEEAIVNWEGDILE